MSTDTINDAYTIQKLGSALADTRSEGAIVPGNSVPFVVVPDDYEIRNIEGLYPQPARQRGTTTLLEQDSFVRFVKEHTIGNTRLYGKPPTASVPEAGGATVVRPPRFLAVFNDSGAYTTGWRDHMAGWECPLSPEWMRWMGNSHRPMKQTDFARFIEDNLPDVVEPAAAQMLELSRTLEAKSEVKFASSVRLADGASELKFEEDIQGTAMKGQMQIPDTFKLGIPVLLGGQAYAVDARFRYRMAGANLHLWYEIVRPHKIIEDVFIDLRTALKEGTGLDVFVGDPEGMLPAMPKVSR